MADNTKIGPIFRGANGGLSDDLFTGIKNSFYFSNDMEIRQDAKSIYPKGVPAYADLTTGINVGDGTSGKRYVKNVTYSQSEGGWLVCADKTIFLISDIGGTVSELCTMGETICDLEIFNGYIYISTKDYLYYKKDAYGLYWGDMASSIDDTEDEYGRCTTSLTNIGIHPLYASDIILCVGDKNKMLKVSRETPSLLEDGFTLQEGYNIRFINELGGFIRAVAVDEPYGSEVLLWDKISDAPNEIIPLEGYTIRGSIIYNGYQYLLSNSGLGLLNGYQYYLLKKANLNTMADTPNCMCVYDDRLYFVSTDGVYIYGAKNKNYADVLNLWHKVEDGVYLGAIGSNSKGIMITREAYNISAGTWQPIRVGINAGTATNGELQTMCYFGTSMSEIKQAMYLRVGYHIPKEGTNSGDIHIYYRTEADATDDNPDNWAWHPIQPNDNGLSVTWDMRSPFATTLKIPDNARFQWIQFKFVLTDCSWIDNGTTKTKDTNLYSADLYYNVMLD